MHCTHLEPVDHPTNAMISSNNVQAEIDLIMLVMMHICADDNNVMVMVVMPIMMRRREKMI